VRRAGPIAVLAAALGAAYAVACSGSSKATVDAFEKHDAPAVYPFTCGSGSACASPNVCCTMPANGTITFACDDNTTCPMNDQIACNSPAGCGGSTPVCCGKDVPDGTGTYPDCTPETLGATCTSVAACPTHIGSNCGETTTVQLCLTSSDCSANTTDTECCTFTAGSGTGTGTDGSGGGSVSLTFCIDKTTAMLEGATCH
jgi:hypothetical protein